MSLCARSVVPSRRHASWIACEVPSERDTPAAEARRTAMADSDSKLSRSLPALECFGVSHDHAMPFLSLSLSLSLSLPRRLSVPQNCPTCFRC